MKIAASAINLFSSHTAIERYTKQEALTFWLGNQEPQIVESKGREEDAKLALQELARLQREAIKLSGFKEVKVRQLRPADVELTDDEKAVHDLNLRLLMALFKKLTGRDMKVFDPAAILAARKAETPQPAASEDTPPAQTQSDGYGLIYQYRESREEIEKTEFAAAGKIVTADGQQLDFTVSLSMNRQFISQHEISLRAGDALKDPLVINFGGTAATLGARDFSFDIDSDGTKDQIAFVGPGSGFLALDKNGDGKINDGGELFGAASGDGFADLKSYDGDGNNWIDENDAVYNKLRIWSRAADGTEQLLGLGQAGVGALYLGHIETLFGLKDAGNEQLGQVKSTGLALMENGQPLTIQQLDLVA
jgi:hypothetical protein